MNDTVEVKVCERDCDQRPATSTLLHSNEGTGKKRTEGSDDQRTGKEGKGGRERRERKKRRKLESGN